MENRDEAIAEVNKLKCEVYDILARKTQISQLVEQLNQEEMKRNQRIFEISKSLEVEEAPNVKQGNDSGVVVESKRKK
jgi:hypothetical protein